ncbi:uncharacterized protein LOC123988088 [Osmia bicornis bicornis]|uniref:uncharacterized protein LOC123988088 n=1 Tax=Osmia bicornis bicornis TaxID=1437191 RepID=UPI001EAE98FE|nr:uncharacterized protein LOC123988088 [Osmia bicornis bicornis]
MAELRHQENQENWTSFRRKHAQITDQKTEETRKLSYFTDDLWTQGEEIFIDNQATLEEYLDRFARTPKPPHGPVAQSITSCADQPGQPRALPKLVLPKFAGHHKKWTPFRDLFQSMVSDNASIPEVEKLHYLKMSVTGEAAQLISNLSVTSDNFKLAWQVLSDRHENRRVLVDTQLDLLFSVKRLQRELATELKRLYGTTNEVIGALNGLKCDTKNWDPIIVYWVSRKFDSNTFREWELHIGTFTEIPTLTQLNDFLLMHVRATESVERFSGSSQPLSRSREVKVQVHQATVNAAACPVCNASHSLTSCPTYLAKPVDQRKSVVAQQRRCFNCLGNHHRKACRSNHRCITCKARHHSTLHESTTSTFPTAKPSPETEPSASEVTAASSVTSHLLSNHVNPRPAFGRMLLATALVKLASPYGETRIARALLDQGSEVSFITESLVQQLHLPRRHATIPVSGIGAGRTVVTRGASTFRISSLVNPMFSCEVNALILPKLTDYIADRSPSLVSLPHLHGLQLADPDFPQSRRIDLIIGVEVYNSVLLSEVVRGPPRTPLAQKTQLGWIVSGPTPQAAEGPQAKHRSSLQCCLDRELVDLVQRFWNQEDYASCSEPTISEADQVCENHFVRTHARDGNGRFTVRLPLARDVAVLGDSRNSAYRILVNSETRLAKNPPLRCAYSQFLTEYERLGHMHRVTPSELTARVAYYLPHHGVLRETGTTKVRVVFNGSHKTSSGLSLNDCLHSGPKLQNDLADVLLRWRQYAFVFLADVEKMYRQIRVHDDDQSLQRILWRRDSFGSIEEYALSTVTYGLACAPYLALRCLRQLSTDHEKEFPLGCTILRDETYVDDVLSGAHSLPEGLEKISQISELLRSGGFQLHKWTANDDRLLSNFSSQSASALGERSLNDDASHQALGLAWNVNRDAFVFTFHNLAHSCTTKRSVLSTVSQLYDPLRWIAPVIVQGKTFMQELWTLKVGWDDPLPAEFVKRWEKFSSNLSEVRAVTIPRWIGTAPTNVSTEIHGFADASSLAMGVIIYLITKDETDQIRTALLMAKTKVAPLKRVTIPRLELSAAALLARIVKRIRKVLKMENAPIHLWTDSAVALAWIRSHPSRWKEFVHNRVSEIQTSLPDATWHHVPGTQNPADLASRGTTPQHLISDALWWSGPPWLQCPSPAWPSEKLTPDDRIDVEMRKSRVQASLVATTESWMDTLKRYSSLSRLCRVTAWCFRAVVKFRSRSAPSPTPLTLSVSELDRARLYWMKETQKEHFQDELSALVSGTTVSKTSSLYNLMPYVDEKGHLRVGGRLRHSQLHPDQKHPLILPRSSPLTSLVIDHAHKNSLHAGPQLTLATIRQSYWIIGGRCPIRVFINKCVVCARQRARTAEQIMGQLPKRRVTHSRAFLHSGVDYAGPFSVRTIRGRGGKIHKAYIAVFICLATGAVHLELVSDYSAEAFIAAYKRFSGRRGIPATITSDCGTNFVCADKELRTMLAKVSRDPGAISTTLVNDGTDWRFNPPSAPHFGGKWEAAVKSVKFHIRRVVGDTALTFEEFTTLLTQIEAVLNSRPLCPLTDYPSDLSALTPGHFLTGDALRAVPEPDLSLVKTARLSRWQLLRQFTENIWDRWSREYLTSLQTASKWQALRNGVQLGNLVLIKDERTPPSKWPLARVTQLHPGRDNLTRVVTLRTASTTLTRPITKLCVLPIDTTDPSAQASDPVTDNRDG